MTAPSSMTDRDRFLATLRFEKPDRVPFTPGSGRRSTLDAWRRQGLARDVVDYHRHVRTLLGIPGEPAEAPVGPGVVFTMIPEFDEKVIEHRRAPREAPRGTPGTQIVQDWKGNVCEIADIYSPADLRGAPDFVTRTWIRCPVQSRADWRDMARRYHVDQPGRFPDDFQQRCKALRHRTYPSGVTLSGPFWQLREWLGFENLCMLLLDDPDFAHEMIDFWRRFVASMLERLFEHYVPDFITFNEDMAYKQRSMISPAMSRTFLLPCWSHWTELARDAGVPVLEVDSDGYVEQLIRPWIEAGFNCTSPMEVAAGNDLPALRRRHDSRMAYRGGIDKRCIAAGGKCIEREIQRLEPVIDAGGYIPGCDHGVPADVSWPNYLHYCRLLARATRWI